jgi:hypothetical protein
MPKGATASRKRKGSTAELGGAAKRRAHQRQRPDPAERNPGGSNTDPAEQGPGQAYVFQVCHHPLNRLEVNRRWQCTNCIKAQLPCNVEPKGACKRCRGKKYRCSLMPINLRTGKTDRRSIPAETLLAFRIKQVEESRAATAKKGKKRARGSPEPGEPGGSDSAPSPSTSLVALGALALDSGRSSAATTSSHSPASLPQPPLPECPSLPPPTALKAGHAFKRSKGKPASNPHVTTPTYISAAFVVEVPSTSQLLKPVRRQASPAPTTDASPVSDEGTLLSRIVALERKQDWLENRVRDIDYRLKKLEE